MLLGFQSGVVLLYRPLQQRVVEEWNSDGLFSSSPVSSLSALPSHHPGLFWASFSDGVIASFVLSSSSSSIASPSSIPSFVEKVGSAESFAMLQASSIAPLPSAIGSSWRAHPAGLVSVRLSPCGSFLAGISQHDRQLLLFDLTRHRLLAAFPAYFGGHLCFCWDPTSRYLIAGGDDDLVCVYSARRGALLARLRGHRAAVTDVAVDPWSSNDVTLRFASVGKDGFFILWELAADFDEQCAEQSTAPLAAPLPHHPNVRRLLEKPIRSQALSHLLFSARFLFISCTTGQVEVFRREPKA